MGVGPKLSQRINHLFDVLRMNIVSVRDQEGNRVLKFFPGFLAISRHGIDQSTRCAPLQQSCDEEHNLKAARYQPVTIASPQSRDQGQYLVTAAPMGRDSFRDAWLEF